MGGAVRAAMLRRAALCIGAAVGGVMACAAAQAQDAMWLAAPASADWNTPANWTPAIVPTNTAAFGASNTTALTFSAATTTTGTIQFNAGAPAYTFSLSGTGNTFDITGAGIVNNSSSSPTFRLVDGPVLNLSNSSSAGNATFNLMASVPISIINPLRPVLNFNDHSTAANATITNFGGQQGGTVNFNNSSSAANAVIVNDLTGNTNFNDQSTAGNAIITLSHMFGVLAPGGLSFSQSSTAGNATITSDLGSINFDNSSTAGTAAITTSGLILFENNSTAGNATITTQPNGRELFLDASRGGNARFITSAGTEFDISFHTGGLSVGSIEGEGNFFLGSNTLTVGGNDLSTTVSGVISDCGAGGTACLALGATGGSLVKTGTGTLTLSGTNTYTGATAIDAGTLSVTGSIATSSGVAINSGATLDGTGTVPAVTVNSGGTLMPGLPGAVGTLQGTGSLLFNSMTAYLIPIHGTTNSLFTTTGGATLNASATVNVASGSTITANHKYTILTATGGVSGRFNPTVDFAAFVGTLSYDTNDVFLTFGFGRLSDVLPPGAPRNVVNVANAIDTFTTGGGTLPAGFAGIFAFTPQQIESALTQLSGEAATGAQLSGFALMNEFMALLIDPLADGHSGIGIGALPFAPADQGSAYTPEVAGAYASVFKAPPAPTYGPWRAWGAAYGGTSNITGDPTVVGSHDVTTRAGGFAAGLDYLASPDTRFGFALAGAGTGWDLAAGLGGGHSDAFQAGLYATHRFGAAYLSGALAFANYWAKTSRTVTVAGADTLTAGFDAQSIGGRIEGGYRLYPIGPAVTVTPYAALQAQSFHLPAYSETAASGSPQFALSFNAQTSDAERAELGSWFADNVLLDRGDVLTLFGRAAWAHDWFNNLALTPSFQALPGASFIVNGAAPPADIALVTAGAEWRLRSNWSLMGRFDGEFGNGQQTYAGTARVRYAW
jgi:autotransporter-associated beta strand protein